MQITKFGHSCILVKENGLSILVDPGAWNELPAIDNLDAIFISHEHPDHLDIEKLKTILKAHSVPIYTNQDVAKKLDEAEVKGYQLIEDNPQITLKDVGLQFFDQHHGVVYPTLPAVKNTGILIANRLFFPGDLLMKIDQEIEILALPVVAPWLKLAEAIDYAKEVHPKVCFPIHDGSLKHLGPSLSLPEKILSPEGVNYQILELDRVYEF